MIRVLRRGNMKLPRSFKRTYVAMGLSLAIILISIFLIFNGNQPSDTTNSSSEGKDISNVTNYQHISFSDDFKTPASPTKPIRIMQLNNLSLNDTTARETLKRHNYLLIDNSSNVTSFKDCLSIANVNNSISIQYIGIIDYRCEDPLYEPVTKSEIEKSESLLNRSEALDIAIDYLKDHGLYNATWEMMWNLTRVSKWVYQNITEVVHYTFKFIPVYDGLPLIDSEAPSITIKINPRGTVEKCYAKIKMITSTKDLKVPEYETPSKVLSELDINFSKYFYVDSEETGITISRIRLGYEIDPLNGNRIVPSWIIYYGDYGLSTCYI